MKFKLFNTILFIGYFYLVNIIPEEYFWLKIIFLILVLLWIWLGEKILDKNNS